MGDIRHFAVTLIALIGGGWLLTVDPTLAEWVKITLTGVLSFWFGARLGNGAPKP